MHDSMRI